MHTQGDLFRPMCARISARQGQLFEDAGPPDSRLRCGACGEHLTRTPGGYLACPRGHGKLLLESPAGEESFGSWFEPDPPEAE
jgi:hypothetical protein